MNHYPHHIGDYIKSTVHLTNEEDLTYWRLICHYYDTERPISKETQTVSKRLRLDNQTVLRILQEFFFEQDDGWHNKRCDEEITWYQQKCARNREVGKLGGRPKKTQVVSRKKRLETVRNPNQNQNHNHNHIKPKPAASAADSVKREIWETGKAILASDGKDAAGFIGKLCKEYGQILVLQAVRDCAQTVPAEPKAWLVARCQERRQKDNGNGKFHPNAGFRQKLAASLDASPTEKVLNDVFGEVQPLLPGSGNN